jgi:phage regulator Rha-like protein
VPSAARRTAILSGSRFSWGRETKGIGMEYSVAVESIVRKILFIRGEKVLLDRDLAEMYGVETKQLKRAVRRNSRRFPPDFMFELTKEEQDFLRSQFGTLKRGEHSKYTPMAFTEQGIAMLSSVLNSERAIEVNIVIMRAFVQLRKLATSYEVLEGKLAELEQRFEDHDEKIETIFEAIRQLMAPPEQQRKKIGFEVKEGKAGYGKN